MMRTIRIAGFALAALTVASAPAMAAGPGTLFGPYPGEMTVYETPDTTLVTIGNWQLRKEIPKLPQLRLTMEHVLHVTEYPTGIPTYTYVVSNSVWHRYLEPSPEIISEFVPTRFANYVIANGAVISRVGLFHEHVHLFLYTQAPGAYPLWFDEGLANLVAQGLFTGDKVRIYPPEPPGHWISTERVLRATKSSPDYLSGQDSHSFHLQSQVMVHRALIEDPEFGKSVGRYLDALNNLQSVEEATQSGFNLSLDALNDQMLGYADRSWKLYASLGIGIAPKERMPAGRELPPVEALWGIATVALDTGLHLDRVGELIDAAEKLGPQNPRTHLLRMRLAARQQDDAELERLYLEIQPRLTDAEVARGAGLASFERTLYLQEQPANASLRQRMLARSFELLDRSLNARPDDPEAVWAFAMAAAGTRQGLATALKRLEPTFAKMPRNPDLATAAALVYEAAGRYEEMLPCLNAASVFSHTYEQKRWAAGKIAEAKEKLAAAKAP